MAPLTLSVIVTTRERSLGCRRLCAALQQQLTGADVIAEILLIFDGCEPYDWVTETAPYRTITLATQVGIARARNAGISAATGDVVAFLDDDAVPADGWLNGLLNGLAAYPDAVAFGGRVIGADQINVYAQLRDQVYYRETFGLWYVNPHAGGDQVGTPYVNGGNSAYRRQPLASAAGFDQHLPAYSDVEIGRRLRLHQHGVLLAAMTIHHDHPSTLQAYLTRCHRSGRARGVLWARLRYPQESPARVTATIVANVLWRNATRSRRVRGRRLTAYIVLFFQEVFHGVGYVRALAG